MDTRTGVCRSPCLWTVERHLRWRRWRQMNRWQWERSVNWDIQVTVIQGIDRAL